MGAGGMTQVLEVHPRILGNIGLAVGAHAKAANDTYACSSMHATNDLDTHRIAGKWQARTWAAARHHLLVQGTQPIRC